MPYYAMTSGRSTGFSPLSPTSTGVGTVYSRAAFASSAAKEERDKHLSLQVIADGRAQFKTVRCVPDHLYGSRWLKTGFAWKDTNFSNEVFDWEGYTRRDFESLCECISKPGRPTVMPAPHMGRAQPSEAQWTEYAEGVAGPINSQRRVDYCWTRYLQRLGGHIKTGGGYAGQWAKSAREPQEVVDGLPPQIPANTRVVNFPNPCVPAIHVPPPCRVVPQINTIYSRAKGHPDAYIIEKQPVENSWIFKTYRTPDPAARYLQATRDSLKPGFDYSVSNPTGPHYGRIRDLNQARENVRNASRSVSGVSTNSAIAIGAVGLATVAAGGIVFLLTRKRR